MKRSRRSPHPESLAFLPAALEIQETPPAPAARAILWTLVGLAMATLGWSMAAKVDIVAVAPGKIIPSGKSKPVQAFEGGRVSRVLVGEGERVRAGQVLLELDPVVSDADVQAAHQRVTKLEKTLPLVRERARAARTLAAQGLLPRADFLAVEEQRIAVEQDLAALRQDLVKVRERRRWQQLAAPVSGQVQQLAALSAGVVVKAGDPLMVIVPEREGLEVEALIANKDRGFVSAGTAVVVKVDTFPFTRYGTLAGRLETVAEDAESHPQLGFVYPSRVALERDTMDVDGRTVRLVAGMTVAVEAATGTRRVIDFILSPVLEHAGGSLRER